MPNQQETFVWTQDISLFIILQLSVIYCTLRGMTRSGHIKLVHEPDHFLVPKGGTNSSRGFCKDYSLECSKSLTGPLYMTIQSMEISTQVHDVHSQSV